MKRKGKDLYRKTRRKILNANLNLLRYFHKRLESDDSHLIPNNRRDFYKEQVTFLEAQLGIKNKKITLPKN